MIHYVGVGDCSGYGDDGSAPFSGAGGDDGTIAGAGDGGVVKMCMIIVIVVMDCSNEVLQSP